LRLNDQSEAPPRLREAIRAMQIRLGRRNPPLPAATLDAAHDLVFAVQQRLMAANPKNPRPTRHAGRPTGQPVITLIREDRKWKVLALPPPPPAARTPTGSTSSNRPWSAPGTAGATPSSRRCARLDCARNHSSRWPSREPRGTTTGCWSRTPTASSNASWSRASCLLEVLSQLVGSDR